MIRIGGRGQAAASVSDRKTWVSRTPGEFGLIAPGDRPARRTASPCLLGPGDDAAVVAAPDGGSSACTDVLVEGRHFRRDWSSARDVGHRAAAANLADIAAMGAAPDRAAGRALHPAPTWTPPGRRSWPTGWPPRRRWSARASSAGDMSASPTLTIAVTALGDLDGRPPVVRSGARPGDVVALAGRIGWAAAGVHRAVPGVPHPEGCWSRRTGGRRCRTRPGRRPPGSAPPP